MNDEKRIQEVILEWEQDLRNQNMLFDPKMEVSLEFRADSHVEVGFNEARDGRGCYIGLAPHFEDHDEDKAQEDKFDLFLDAINKHQFKLIELLYAHAYYVMVENHDQDGHRFTIDFNIDYEGKWVNIDLVFTKWLG